jgi:hypothetical protein
MKSYTLVNPQIKGSIDVEFKCNSAIEAANLHDQNGLDAFPNIKTFLKIEGEQ